MTLIEYEHRPLWCCGKLTWDETTLRQDIFGQPPRTKCNLAPSQGCVPAFLAPTTPSRLFNMSPPPSRSTICRPGVVAPLSSAVERLDREEEELSWSAKPIAAPRKLRLKLTGDLDIEVGLCHSGAAIVCSCAERSPSRAHSPVNGDRRQQEPCLRVTCLRVTRQDGAQGDKSAG